MPNAIKMEKVKYLESKFKDSSAIYFTNYSGMSVTQATKIRNKFTEQNVEFLVSKNTITKIGAKNAGFQEGMFDEILTGQIAIAYAQDDPSAPAKVIKDFSKENDCLEVVGLLIDGELFEPSKYKQLADLPSKEELLTKLVLTLNSPITKFASSLNSVMSKFVTALNGIKENK